jgi:hypothetical protein
MKKKRKIPGKKKPTQETWQFYAALWAMVYALDAAYQAVQFLQKLVDRRKRLEDKF